MLVQTQAFSLVGNLLGNKSSSNNPATVTKKLDLSQPIPVNSKLAAADPMLFFIENIVEKCTIKPGCLDVSPIRSTSFCEQQSLEKIKDFIKKHKVLSGCQIFVSRRILEKAVLFATEILGSDSFLTTDQLEKKSQYHLLMSVQMSVEWLLDDTLDTNSSVESNFATEITNFYLALLELDINIAPCIDSLKFAGVHSGIPEEFFEALFLFAKWQRDLALSLNISLDSSSLYYQLHRDFLATYSQTRDVFDSWELFTEYRSANGGLTLEILCGAYCFCDLWNIDINLTDFDREKYALLINKYSILGAVSNDLFGYEKDLEEAIATSVEVVKHCLYKGNLTSVDLTVKAFWQIIEFHNRCLEDLIEQFNVCENQTERAILFSALTTTWAVRVLHHEYRNIYQADFLRKVLNKTSFVETHISQNSKQLLEPIYNNFPAETRISWNTKTREKIKSA